MPNIVTENKKLRDYFNNIYDNPDKDKEQEEKLLLEFVREQMDKFDWGKDIARNSAPEISSPYILFELDPWEFYYSKKESNDIYVTLTFTAEHKEEFGHLSDVEADAIFMQYTGAFVKFTEESLYTNKLRDFCQTLGQVRG